MTDRSKFAAKEGGFAWLFSLFGAIVRYGNNIILTRLLGASSFGIYALANTIVTVTSIATSFGLPSAMVHFVAKEKEKQNYSSLIWFIRKGIKITSFLHGGAQERGRRASTENVPGVVGLGKAIELAVN
ncbi:MAG: oligosaccharide flippase family protein, partial [Acidobacteria bacterium]|nr:oligosaccharide flippase family protein [Acidobacteriota bacterium]